MSKVVREGQQIHRCKRQGNVVLGGYQLLCKCWIAIIEIKLYIIMFIFGE